jgi:hypothetical protein
MSRRIEYFLHNLSDAIQFVMKIGLSDAIDSPQTYEKRGKESIREKAN